ncbi:Plasma membrane sulfite pump involved in sulfite metabolism [Coemansia sp. RSA 720]|nr:Plasma membrane sulfite pump involved in sulfite metabolism [Coemansia sp. RSA 720]
MRRNPRRMLHYGAIPMALGTVLTGISAYQIYEMNHAVVYITWSIWWISVVLAAAASVLLICLIVSRETRSIESVTGAWLLLVAPLAVCASTGASIAAYLPTELAYMTLIVSYALLGAGAPLTCCILVLYVARITTFKLPPHDAIVTSFIPLGPAGQIGVAALSLGRMADTVLLDSTPQLDTLGPTMLGAGVLIALMAWGFCVFLLTHAVFSVVYQRRSAVIPFNISWWSLTFSVGVFGSLTAELGEVLDMRYLQVNYMVMVVLLLVLWMFNMVRTIVGAWTGSIFGIPSLANKEDATKESTSSAVTICDIRPADRYV